MGLFTKSDSKNELASLRAEWRGRLSEELWSSDPDHQTYVETAQELPVEYARLSLRTKAKRNLPADIDATMKKLLAVFAPQSAEVPTLADSATTAYLLSSAECWAELDRDEVARLANQGWERFQRNNPASSHTRFRRGMTLLGLTSCHVTQPEGKRHPEFEALGRYVMGQPAYHRLLALETHFCNMDFGMLSSLPKIGKDGKKFGGRDLFVSPSSNLFAHSADHTDLNADVDEWYRWNNARSWHLGVSTWVLEDCGWLRGR